MQDETVIARGESRFVSNTVALVFQTVAATLLTLLQIKLLSNYLSKESFGLLASLRGLSLLLATLAAHGLPLLLVRFIPGHEARRERGQALRLASVCVIVSLVGLAVVIAAAHALGRWVFAFVPGDALTADLYLWFYATTVGVMLKLVLYGGLNGSRRLAAQVLLETLSLLAVLVWIIADRRELTLPLVFRILGVVNIATVCVGFPLFLAGLKSTALTGVSAGADRGGGGAGYRSGYASYLVWAAGLSFVALAFSDADRYLLAQVLTLELLAAFHIGARVAHLANRLLGVANLAFQPEITRLDAEGRDERVVQSTRIFFKFNSVFAVLMTAFIIVFARDLVVIVSSEAYTAAVPLLVILGCSLPLSTMTAPVTTVMKALDQVRGALLCDVAWFVCYVGLIFVLARPLGLVGVGCAQLVACAAQLLLALRLSKVIIGTGYVLRLAWRLLLAGGAAFLPVLAFEVFAGRGHSITAIGAKVLLYLFGVVLFRWLVRAVNVFDGGERATLAAALGTRKLGIVGRVVGV